MVNIRVLPATQEDIRYCIEYARDEFGRKCVLRWKKELEAIYARLIMFPLSYSPEPILKHFHRDYRSALLMDNFKLIYRYDKERDEIIIFFIPYYILKGYTSCSSFHESFSSIASRLRAQK